MNIRALIPAPGWRVLSCAVDEDDEEYPPSFELLPVIGWAATGRWIELIVWDEDHARRVGGTYYFEHEEIYPPGEEITEEEKARIVKYVRWRIKEKRARLNEKSGQAAPSARTSRGDQTTPMN